MCLHDSPSFQCRKCIFWSWPCYSMKHRHQRVILQTCMQTFDLQLFWRWWRHPYRWDSIPWQYTTSAVPHRWLLATMFHIHPQQVCYPRWRRERGLPNCCTNWWTWNNEEISDRQLCIHEHSLPHRLCPYLCPYSDYQTSSYYDTLELSDISEFEDLMTTSSDEDIPTPNDIGYRKRLWLEMNIYIHMNSKISPCSI